LDTKDSIVLDLSKTSKLFCGNNAHGVQPFKGDRFSLVFFTTSKWWKMKAPEAKKLTQLGFKVPTRKSMDSVKAAVTKLDEQRAR